MMHHKYFSIMENALKVSQLLEVKRPIINDTDDLREYLADLGSAADLWMGEPQLEKLLALVQAGKAIKCMSIDCSKAEDKHEANDIKDKRLEKYLKAGFEEFDFEWDGDGESVDVVLVKK